MAEEMHRTQFCNARETILVKLGWADGFTFDETDNHGKVFENVSDAVTYLTADHAVEYLRFDLDTLTAENVTEEFATEWLRKFEGSPDDEDILPTYVRTSEAWDAFCEDYTIRNGMAFTQRGHGTLNLRQQGIGR